MADNNNFSAEEIAVLRDLISRHRDQMAIAQSQIISAFALQINNLDPKLILGIAEQAGLAAGGSRETVVAAICAAIGEPLSNFDPAIWTLLKGAIFARLESLRPLAIGYVNWYL